MKSWYFDLMLVVVAILGALPSLVGGDFVIPVVDPPPISVEGKYGVIFAETSDRTGNIGMVLNSKAIYEARSEFKQWRQFDDDEVSELWKPVLEQARKRGDFALPWMVIIDGQNWKQGPLPLVKSNGDVDVDASIQAIVSAIEEFK